MLKKHLKIAWNMLRIRSLIAIILCIQMLLGIVLLSIGLTTWNKETKLVRQYENSNLPGSVVMMPNTDMELELDPNPERIREMIQTISAIAPTENWAMGVKTVATSQEVEDGEASCIIGDTNYFTTYESCLSKGTWFSESTRSNAYYECVISKDLATKYKLNDIYTISLTDDAWENSQMIDIKVIGVLDDTSYHLVSQGNSLETVLGKYEGMLINMKNVANVRLDLSNMQCYLLNAKVTPTRLNYEYSSYASFFSMDELYDRYFESNKLFYYLIFLIIIIVLSLLFAGVSGYSLLTINETTRTYMIYYVNGLQWKKCILYEWIKITILYAIPSSILTFFYLIFYSSMKQNIDWSYFIVALLLCYLLYVLASVYAIMNISKKNPIEIIRGGI